MNSQKIEFQRYRDFGQIINATFEFIRENFKQLAKAVIFLVGPFILLTGIFGGLYQKNLFSFTSSLTSLSQFGVAFGLYILFAMISTLVLISTIYSYIILYIKREDEILI